MGAPYTSAPGDGHALPGRIDTGNSRSTLTHRRNEPRERRTIEVATTAVISPAEEPTLRVLAAAVGGGYRDQRLAFDLDHQHAVQEQVPLVTRRSCSRSSRFCVTRRMSGLAPPRMIDS
jgi:hypothetical protein